MTDLSPPATSLPFSEQLAAFYTYMRSERQLSLHTQTNYARDLEKFQLFCESKSIRELHLLGVNHVRMAVTQLNREGLGGKSLQRWLSSLRSFFQFCIKRGWLKNNLADGIAAPKSPKVLPKTLDADQAAQFVQVEGDDFINKRARALLELI